MGVTLNNISDGGTVNITINVVTNYLQVYKNTYYSRKVPGKTTPSVDTTSFVVTPKEYRLTALIKDVDKVEMEQLQTEMDSRIVFTDGELSNKNTRLISINLTARTGQEESGRPANSGVYPWQVEIRLLAEDH